MLIFRQFTFDSAHYLPNVPDGHKCRNLHGHTYILKVFLEGTPDADTGWIIDFAAFKTLVNKVLTLLDHKFLNDVKGLQNPTCELLAVWLWTRLKEVLPQLCRIELNETPNAGVIYTGD